MLMIAPAISFSLDSCYAHTHTHTRRHKEATRNKNQTEKSTTKLVKLEIFRVKRQQQQQSFNILVRYGVREREREKAKVLQPELVGGLLLLRWIFGGVVNLSFWFDLHVRFGWRWLLLLLLCGSVGWWNQSRFSSRQASKWRQAACARFASSLTGFGSCCCCCS